MAEALLYFIAKCNEVKFHAKETSRVIVEVLEVVEHSQGDRGDEVGEVVLHLDHVKGRRRAGWENATVGFVNAKTAGPDGWP